MKKYFIFYFITSLLVLLTQCKSSELVSPLGNYISFENLAVGQKSLYVRWESNNLWANNVSFKPTSDTIALRVISQDEKGFKIAEEHLNKKIATQYYYFNIKDNQLHVFGSTDSATLNSFMMHVTGKYALSDNNLKAINVNKWGIPDATQVTEFTAKIGKTKLGDITTESALLYFNGSRTVLDGPFHVYIYHKNYGFMSFQNLASESSFGQIYYLIAQNP